MLKQLARTFSGGGSGGFTGEDGDSQSRLTWAPLLIHVSPPFSGKRDFIKSLQEPSDETILSHTSGLYGRVSTDDALAVWEGKTPMRLNQFHPEIVTHLNSFSCREMELLTLYYRKKITKKDFIDGVAKSLDPYLMQEFSAAIEEIATAKQIPRMKSNEIYVFLPSALPSAMEAAMKDLKHAVKRNPNIVTWDDNNISPTYNYREALALAEKYHRSVRFVRWTQEIPAQRLAKLMKQNILRFLEWGSYVDSRKLGKAYMASNALVRNEIETRMRHSDFALLAGYDMDECGMVRARDRSRSSSPTKSGNQSRSSSPTKSASATRSTTSVGDRSSTSINTTGDVNKYHSESRWSKWSDSTVLHRIVTVYSPRGGQGGVKSRSGSNASSPASSVDGNKKAGGGITGVKFQEEEQEKKKKKKKKTADEKAALKAMAMVENATMMTHSMQKVNLLGLTGGTGSNHSNSTTGSSTMSPGGHRGGGGGGGGGGGKSSADGDGDELINSGSGSEKNRQASPLQRMFNGSPGRLSRRSSDADVKALQRAEQKQLMMLASQIVKEEGFVGGGGAAGSGGAGVVVGETELHVKSLAEEQAEHYKLHTLMESAVKEVQVGLLEELVRAAALQGVADYTAQQAAKDSDNIHSLTKRFGMTVKSSNQSLLSERRSFISPSRRQSFLSESGGNDTGSRSSSPRGTSAAAVSPKQQSQQSQQSQQPESVSAKSSSIAVKADAAGLLAHRNSSFREDRGGRGAGSAASSAGGRGRGTGTGSGGRGSEMMQKTASFTRTPFAGSNNNNISSSNNVNVSPQRAIGSGGANKSDVGSVKEIIPLKPINISPPSRNASQYNMSTSGQGGTAGVGAGSSANNTSHSSSMANMMLGSPKASAHMGVKANPLMTSRRRMSSPGGHTHPTAGNPPTSPSAAAAVASATAPPPPRNPTPPATASSNNNTTNRSSNKNTTSLLTPPSKRQPPGAPQPPRPEAHL